MKRKGTLVRRTSATATAKKSNTTRQSEELIVVSRNNIGAFTGLTNALASKKINIECVSAYEWSQEAAFRIVTDNNKKASKVLSEQGYEVQSHPVTLWFTKNEPGYMNRAISALSSANINTYCCYATAVPGSNASVVSFNTNDPEGTLHVLNGL